MALRAASVCVQSRSRAFTRPSRVLVLITGKSVVLLRQLMDR